MSVKSIQKAESIVPKGVNDYVDSVELFMLKEMVENGDYQVIECPLNHTFTPGLYSRRITMPAGSRVTSKIHKTEHQFAVLKGKVTVRTFVGDRFYDVELQAGDSGITMPGTRRILIIHDESDCVWITFHATDKTTPEEVEADIIEYHVNPMFEKDYLEFVKNKNNINSQLIENK